MCSGIQYVTGALLVPFGKALHVDKREALENRPFWLIHPLLSP